MQSSNFLIICMIIDRIGLQSVLLPLLRPSDNAQKSTCELFGIFLFFSLSSVNVSIVGFHMTSLKFKLKKY